MEREEFVVKRAVKNLALKEADKAFLLTLAHRLRKTVEISIDVARDMADVTDNLIGEQERTFVKKPPIKNFTAEDLLDFNLDVLDSFLSIMRDIKLIRETLIDPSKERALNV